MGFPCLNQIEFPKGMCIWREWLCTFCS